MQIPGDNLDPVRIYRTYSGENEMGCRIDKGSDKEVCYHKCEERIDE